MTTDLFAVDCSACAKAEAGNYHTVNTTCQGCAVREIGRSPIGFEALQTGKGAKVRAAVAQKLPSDRVDWGMAEVKRWAIRFYGEPK